MADNTEKKILVSVDVVDNYLSAKKNVDEWKKALKNAEKDQNISAEQLREIETNLKKAENEYKKSQRTLQSQVKGEEVLNSLWKQSNHSLAEMQQALTALRNIPLDNLIEEQIREVNQQMADLNSKIQDYKNEIKGLDTSAVFGNMADGLQTVTASASALSSTLNILGVESEAFDKLQKSTVQLIALIQALGVVSDYLTKKKYNLIAANIKNIALTQQETIAKKLNQIQTYQQVNAENLSTAAKIKGAIAIKTLTAAQWLWNIALSANPVFAIIAAIALLVTGIALLASWLDKSSESQRNAAKAQADYEVQAAKTQNRLEIIENKRLKQYEEAALKGREEIRDLKKNNATKEELAKKEYEINTKLRSIQIKASRDIVKEKTKEFHALEKNIEAQKKRLSGLSAGSKKYKEQAESIRDLVKAHNELANAIIEEDYKVKNLQEDQLEADEDLKNKGIELAKERADKHFEQLNKTIDRQKRHNEAMLKAEEKYQSDDFLIKSKYQEKIFYLNQKSQKDKLDLQRKYKKITEEEYREELAIIQAAQTEFNNNASKNLENYYKQQKNVLLDLIGKDVEIQIQDLEEKYKKVLDSFSMPEPVRQEGQSDEEFAAEYNKYKTFMLEKAALEKKLEKQKEKDIKAIRDAALDKQIADIEKAVSDIYKNDLAKYSDNERKKTEVEIQSLQDTITRKKAAGLQTYEDEAQLRSLRSKANQIELNTDLLKANENAEAKYRIRKEFLEKERELYKDNADKLIEINAELAANDRELMEARIAMFEEWAYMTTDLLYSLNDLSQAFADRDLQRYEKTNEKEKAILDERLSQGLISQEQYDKGVEKADTELENKKAAIVRKQAIRERTAKVFEIGLNTAAAVMKNTAQLGMIPAIPVNLMTKALGAIQLAAVVAEPLPKARRGMVIRGKSHENGGVPIEAEHEELIMTKGVYRNPALRQLASMVNVAAGGIPFTSSVPDGGYAARMAETSISESITKRDMQEVMEKAKVYITVEDYRRAEQNYAKIEGRSNY